MRCLKGGKQHEEINESVCCLLLMEREKSEEVAKWERNPLGKNPNFWKEQTAIGNREAVR